MNKRIFELSEQAKLRSPLLLWHLGNVDALTDSEQEELESIEKFAELIIQECAKVIIDNEIDHPITGALYDGDQAKAIKKHFGVEE